MNVVVSYVFPSINIGEYLPYARRFVKSYMDNPPGAYPHKLAVLVNGPLYRNIEKTFDPLAVEFHHHNNYGRDLGAYQMAAATIPCDLMICLGAPLRCRMAGWLDWIVECYLNNGPALYGAWAFGVPRPHIRTTCFWCPPELINSYPYEISSERRYEVEHGANSLTLWSKRMGFPTLMVSRRGVFDMPDWHHVANEDNIFLDQHSDHLGYT